MASGQRNGSSSSKKKWRGGRPKRRRPTSGSGGEPALGGVERSGERASPFGGSVAVEGSRGSGGGVLFRPCSALAAGFKSAAAEASGGGAGGGRWWRQRRAPRGGRSGTRSRCWRPTSSTPTTCRRGAPGTTTGRACRCGCPAAPPRTSSSSSCSGPAAASPAPWASSGSSSTGLCGRHHNHVHPRKESQHQGILRSDISLPHATGTRDQRHR